jgi:hypothetical protein
MKWATTVTMPRMAMGIAFRHGIRPSAALVQAQCPAV